MKYKGCLARFAVLLAMIAAFIIVVRHVQSGLHPVYHGKRLVEWANEAIFAEDHTTRQRAIKILGEACRHEGEEARLRVYKEFVAAKRDRERREQLPEEVLPFLLERFREEDHCAPMVAGGLEKCPPSSTVPKLMEMLREERDTYKQHLLIRTLGRIGPPAQEAAPLIRQALSHMDSQHQEEAREALKKIDREGRQ